LSNRPIVVRGSSEVELLMHRTGDICVRYDSHTNVDLQLHDKIIQPLCQASLSAASAGPQLLPHAARKTAVEPNALTYVALSQPG